MARRRRAQRTTSSHRSSGFDRKGRKLSGLEQLEHRQLLTVSGYEQINLVSDQAGTALIVDPNLVNPYGIAMAAGSGDAWVANAGSNTLSRYIGAVGNTPFKIDSPTISTIAGTGPTGIVSNATGDFVVQIPGGGQGAAPFIFALQNGQIDVAPTLTTGTATAGNNAASGAFYTGLAMVTVNSHNYLYAANFAAGTISVFDNHFQLQGGLVSGAFQDPNLPSGYSPYNVQVLTVNGAPLVFVTYAKQDPSDTHKIASDSKGVIDVYALDGTFKTELVTTSDSHLKSPWGLAIAPSTFGDLKNDLLVANGDGTIQAYSITMANSSATPTASYAAALTNSAGATITIPGLHGLAFGNNASAGKSDTLFFTAGGSNNTHGLFGEIINAFDNPLSAAGTSFTATETTSFSGVVAAFTPEAGRVGHTFTAMINWGDGSTASSGAVVSNGSGGFLVTGSHTYSAPGAISGINVSIVDTTTAGATASVLSSALVVEGNLTATPVAVNATEGTGFTGIPIATFTDPSAGASSASYTATINWGDGASSTGQVTGSSGTFTISGSHSYSQQGTKNFTVLISEGAATPTPITVSGSATVADADTLSMTAVPVSATEGSTFSGAVAKFTDTFTATPAGSFTATIDWGDGATTNNAQVTGSNGSFTISGSHVYAVQGTPTIKVTVAENNATASASASATATVADGDVFTSPGLTLGTTAGAAFSGPVAVFTDNITSTLAADLHASIDWGDGTTADAGVVSGGSGTFTVTGSHTYASPGGPHQVTVILAENSPLTASGTAHSTALVFDPNLSGSPATLTSTEATAIASSTTVATFTDADAGATAGQFSAAIDWGDGTTVSNGQVTGSSGTFTVAGGHTYADDGHYTVKVTLFQQSTGTAPALTIASTANIADAPLSITVGPIGTTEGSKGSLTSFPVATFTDANPNSLSSDFTAKIDWGDGTTDTGVITKTNGTFTVKGSHAYLDEGTKTLKVTVFENSSTGNTVSASASATIAEGDSFTGNLVASLSTTEGATFSGALAVFVDGNTLATASGFTAIIDWGDGHTESGAVTGTNGTLTVSGSHSYVDDGFYPLKVTLVDTGGTNAVASGTASVNEDSGFAVTAATITGTEGATFSGTVATFTDVGSTQASSHYTATIDWGDGTSTTTGNVTGSNGTFTVAGSHKYADEGPFHPVVTIKEVNSPATISATGLASMADADTLTATGVTFTPTRGVSFTGNVATFTDTFTGATAGDFTATIDWGDGTTTTTGNVTGSNGTFTVQGTHTYTQPGAEAVKVVIQDTHGTAKATASSTAKPISSTVSATASPVNVSTGVSVSSAVVATFVDSTGALPVADYTATINWGDGSSSTGTITLSGSTFTVRGSHVYAEPKIWNLTIIVSPAAGSAVTATSKATLGSETERFVAQVYHDVLSRQGELSGIEYWTDRINKGGSRSQEALFIEHSQEYRSNTIQGLYRLLLHRTADSAALAQFNSVLISSYATGADASTQIAESLISSSEYFQSRGGGSASGFLNALYSDLLSRSPDSATTAAWLAKNLNDSSVRAQAAASVFDSDEYLTQLLNLTQPRSSNAFADEVVRGFFQTYLHRDADAASLQHFLSLLKSGQQPEVIASQIIGSAEYDGRV